MILVLVLAVGIAAIDYYLAYVWGAEIAEEQGYSPQAWRLLAAALGPLPLGVLVVWITLGVMRRLESRPSA